MLNHHLRVMSPSEKLEVLNTPERLIGNIDREHHTGPQETEPPESLGLGRAGLTHVSDCILKNSTLKYLYLEGNQISDIPDSFFISLPRLLWLDLRNNQIPSLPAQIGSHRALKTLLLEGNPITELPPELGHVISLSGLNLRYCPITFPPPDVVSRGVRSILQYLRGALAKRPLGVRTTPPLEFPVVEKLQLSESMESSGEEQEPVEEEELRRFRELKHKMILLDEAELGPATPANDRGRFPATNRKKAACGAGLIPELPLFGRLRLKEPERRQTVKKLPEPRRRYLETLHSRCTGSEIARERQISSPRKPETPRKAEELQRDLTPLVMDSVDSPPEQKARSARVPEQHICSFVYGMQERRRGASTRQMALAERGVKETRGSQARVPQKKNRGRGEQPSRRLPQFPPQLTPAALLHS
ncbi:leucine-rich repeat-containing protein 27 [Takifugu rubripes]|uniref:Leucine rich repeat containing 27 n=1 Tax=Takifugu rubripes TaxID=31033 RepID=A0A674MLY4_TAKRU|nr:leucine-rich repeat-containing protein 27 [Takifugu rubripes]